MEKEGISLCVCRDLYFQVNCVSVVLEDKCTLYLAAAIYFLSLAHVEETSMCLSWELSFLRDLWHGPMCPRSPTVIIVFPFSCNVQHFFHVTFLGVFFLLFSLLV